jgi:phytanoyl-CoA hydroxylase
MAQKNEYAIDGSTGGEYPEWLYDYATVATSGVKTFDDITDEHIEQFHERGYLVIHEAFTQIETAQGMDGLLHLMTGKNPDFTGHQLEKIPSKKIDSLNLNQHKEFIRKLFYFVEYDQRLKDMAFNPKLLDVLQRIIGDDDLSMFQDMALLKQARIGREKPWHQDMAYFNVPLDTTIIGAWIALDEATVDNGCMMIIPGSHKKGAVIHFRKRDWQICDTDVMNDSAVAVPLKPGGVLLFHGLIHHGTPANRTDNHRRALQFHYRSANVQTTSEEERLLHWGSEGKDVTC